MAFVTGMVRAIRHGYKTQTRRLVTRKGYTIYETLAWTGKTEGDLFYFQDNEYPEDGALTIRCPLGQVGDRIWVRETWAAHKRFDEFPPRSIPFDETPQLWYRADEAAWEDPKPSEERGKWRPPMFMVRGASRILLEVTRIRLQRLQAISSDDCEEEGICKSKNGLWCGGPHKAHKFPTQHNTPRVAFRHLWDGITPPERSWETNPLVWAATFKVLEK